ncbi:hypothetical protein MAE02_71460 [Microvirga aerophila]|uniref:IPTL-CTERM protein sorting domain-containing protein n=1 Tax=Microvirga aerophila TaxID=670291 RepID=A0A512C5K7_9HYPH|nr:hypothetical protein MAE02_71460 [Microvirga aerophila]
MPVDPLGASKGGQMRHVSSAALTSLTLFATSSSLALAQTTAPGTPPAGPAATPEGGITDWWWIILLVIVAAAAIWYFTRRRTTL